MSCSLLYFLLYECIFDEKKITHANLKHKQYLHAYTVFSMVCVVLSNFKNPDIKFNIQNIVPCDILDTTCAEGMNTT